MKFLCDNCKAKYQIADEKVAGKTVRMKCRKCGHQIEVRAAVTETSVASGPPKAPSEAPRPGARGGLATSLSATKPRAPAAGAAQGPAGGALAGAFQRTVQDAPQTAPYQAQPSAIELSVTDEWYVAINGVPVGPVRISELRRKAAAGAVTEDSLCWQEGLEEWRPVRSLPDLAAIVREAAQGNRPSLMSPPPAEQGRGSAPPRAPARPSAPARPDSGRLSEPPLNAPRPLQPSPARSNVVPLRVAASSNVDDGASLAAPLGGAAAALAPSFAPQPQPFMQPTPAPVAISDPFAVPPASAPAIAASPSGSASLVPPVFEAPKRTGVPLWFWPILLFTLGFGGMAAYFLFKQQQPPAPVVINMPATNTAVATGPTGDIPPPTTATAEPSASPSSTAPTKVATGPKAGGGATNPTPTPPKPGGVDVSGLLGGAGGPAVGPGNTPGAGSGGGLDQAGVERVVAARRMGVRRTCWDSGNNDKKSSVNVTVSATVNPDGSVGHTSSSGDDPQVGKCIENQVRSWRFPAPGSTTTINIPFKFVRQ